MERMFRKLTALSALALMGVFLLPEPADAGRRRNYAEEWEREDREERYRQEREKEREARREHQKQVQDSYQKHRERQLDAVIGHHERTGHHGAHAPVGGGAPPASSGGSGTCIYGADNKVLYQPAGVTCTYR